MADIIAPLSIQIDADTRPAVGEIETLRGALDGLASTSAVVATSLTSLGASSNLAAGITSAFAASGVALIGVSRNVGTLKDNLVEASKSTDNLRGNLEKTVSSISSLSKPTADISKNFEEASKSVSGLGDNLSKSNENLGESEERSKGLAESFLNILGNTESFLKNLTNIPKRILDVADSIKNVGRTVEDISNRAETTFRSQEKNREVLLGTIEDLTLQEMMYAEVNDTLSQVETKEERRVIALGEASGLQEKQISLIRDFNKELSTLEPDQITQQIEFTERAITRLTSQFSEFLNRVTKEGPAAIQTEFLPVIDRLRNQLNFEDFEVILDVGDSTKTVGELSLLINRQEKEVERLQNRYTIIRSAAMRLAGTLEENIKGFLGLQTATSIVNEEFGKLEEGRRELEALRSELNLVENFSEQFGDASTDVGKFQQALRFARDELSPEDYNLVKERILEVVEATDRYDRSSISLNERLVRLREVQEAQNTVGKENINVYSESTEEIAALSKTFGSAGARAIMYERSLMNIAKSLGRNVQATLGYDRSIEKTLITQRQQTLQLEKTEQAQGELTDSNLKLITDNQNLGTSFEFLKNSSMSVLTNLMNINIGSSEYSDTIDNLSNSTEKAVESNKNLNTNLLGNRLRTEALKDSTEQLEKARLDAARATRKQTEDTEKNTKSTEDNTDATERNISKVGQSISGLRSLIAGAGIGLVFRELAEAAASAEESINAVNVVFGTGSDIIHEFGSTASESVLLSTTQFNMLSTDVGVILNQIGLGAKATSDLTIELVERAADIASLRDQETREVLRSLISGLTGSSEAVNRYGINLRAAAIEQEALNAGIVSTVSELTEEQKIQLRVNRILADTEKAKGDLANTSESLANQIKSLSTNWAEFRDVLATRLAPTLANIVGGLNNLLENIQNLPRGTFTAITSFVGLTGALSAMVVVIPKVIAGLKALGATITALFIANPVGLVIAGLAAAISGVAIAVNAVTLNRMTEELEELGIVTEKLSNRQIKDLANELRNLAFSSERVLLVEDVEFLGRIIEDTAQGYNRLIESGDITNKQVERAIALNSDIELSVMRQLMGRIRLLGLERERERLKQHELDFEREILLLNRENLENLLERTQLQIQSVSIRLGVDSEEFATLSVELQSLRDRLKELQEQSDDFQSSLALAAEVDPENEAQFRFLQNRLELEENLRDLNEEIHQAELSGNEELIKRLEARYDMEEQRLTDLTRAEIERAQNSLNLTEEQERIYIDLITNGEEFFLINKRTREEIESGTIAYETLLENERLRSIEASNIEHTTELQNINYKEQQDLLTTLEAQESRIEEIKSEIGDLNNDELRTEEEKASRLAELTDNLEEQESIYNDLVNLANDQAFAAGLGALEIEKQNGTVGELAALNKEIETIQERINQAQEENFNIEEDRAAVLADLNGMLNEALETRRQYLIAEEDIAHQNDIQAIRLAETEGAISNEAAAKKLVAEAQERINLLKEDELRTEEEKASVIAEANALLELGLSALEKIAFQRERAAVATQLENLRSKESTGLQAQLNTLTQRRALLENEREIALARIRANEEAGEPILLADLRVITAANMEIVDFANRLADLELASTFQDVSKAITGVASTISGISRNAQATVESFIALDEHVLNEQIARQMEAIDFEERLNAEGVNRAQERANEEIERINERIATREITEEEGNKRIEKLNKDVADSEIRGEEAVAQRRYEIELEQFENQKEIAARTYELQVGLFGVTKAIRIAETVASGLQGAAEAIAKNPLGLGQILAAIIGITTAANVALIAAQQPPPPPAILTAAPPAPPPLPRVPAASLRSPPSSSEDPGADRNIPEPPEGEFVVNINNVLDFSREEQIRKTTRDILVPVIRRTLVDSSSRIQR